MSDKAKEILKSIQNGTLPPIQSNTKPTIGSGTTTSQRGINKTDFGLQTLNEGAAHSENSKD